MGNKFVKFHIIPFCNNLKFWTDEIVMCNAEEQSDQDLLFIILSASFLRLKGCGNDII